MKEEVELWQRTKRPILITSRCSADVCLLITWRSLTMTSCSHVGKAYLTFSSCWRSNPYWLSHFFPTNQPTIKTLRRVTTPWNMTTRLLCLTTVSDLPLLIYKFILDLQGHWYSRSGTSLCQRWTFKLSEPWAAAHFHLFLLQFCSRLYICMLPLFHSTVSQGFFLH